MLTNEHLLLPGAHILSSVFRQQVLALMVSKRRLSAEFAQNISNWRHNGFQVHCGPSVEADQPQALERLAALILRPSFASTMASLSPRQAQEIRASTDSVFWDDVPVWNE
jgi:hypothetical protein